MIRSAKSRISTACLVLAAACLAVAAGQENPPATENALWYRTPAQNWEAEALPIGNGRLGGMIFGGVDREHIQFNEDSLWIGDEHDTGAYQAFGDLYVDFGDATDTAGAQSYARTLDIGRCCTGSAIREAERRTSALASAVIRPR